MRDIQDPYPTLVQQRSWQTRNTRMIRPTVPDGEVMRHLLQTPDASIAVETIARKTGYEVLHVLSICRQFAALGVAREIPPQGRRFMVSVTNMPLLEKIFVQMEIPEATIRAICSAIGKATA